MWLLMWTTTVCSSQLLVEWCRFVFRDKCNQLNIWLPHSSNWVISVCKCREVKFRAQQTIDHVLLYRNLLFWIPTFDFQCSCVQLDYMTGVLRHLNFMEFKGILLVIWFPHSDISSLFCFCCCFLFFVGGYYDLALLDLNRLMFCFLKSNSCQFIGFCVLVRI